METERWVEKQTGRRSVKQDGSSRLFLLQEGVNYILQTISSVLASRHILKLKLGNIGPAHGGSMQ
jgi:hypothetical protein